MNKRISLTLKITYIFAISFVLTSVLLVVFITGVLNDFYETAVFERLETTGRTLQQSDVNPDFAENGETAHIRYKSDQKLYTVSENMDDFINPDQVRLLINKSAVQDNGVHRFKNSIEDEIIRYVVFKSEGFFDIQKGDVLIVLTDNRLVEAMAGRTTGNILLISFMAFLTGYFIILLWTGRLVRDAGKISSFLSRAALNRFSEGLRLERNDELGDIASGIEDMRMRINENEQQKQDLIQGVSHDLRTPLSIIRSHAEALKDQMCSAEEAYAAIDRECVRLNEKITKLLHFTRLGYIESNPGPEDSVRMDLLIEDILPSFRFKTGASFEKQLEETVFKGDRDSWDAVVSNLLDNATRYARSVIRIRLSEGNLFVYNDGSHIADDKVDDIFNAYEKSADGRFGLGLAIVKRTVDIFGYKVRAQNVDEGVEFAIMPDNRAL